MINNEIKKNPDLNNELESKLNAFHDTYIIIPRHEEVVDKMHKSRMSGRFNTEPRSLLVVGESGVGKTAVINRYLRKYPSKDSTIGYVESKQVISILITRPASILSLGTSLLAKLHAPSPNKGTRASMTYRLTGIDEKYSRRANNEGNYTNQSNEVGLLKECGVELIILDELHHLLEANADGGSNGIANWLKSIINGTNTPMVLYGLPYSESILRANVELRQRFRATITIDPFTWGRTKESQEEFRNLLNMLDQAMPFPESSNLASKEMSFRFFCASHGLLRPIMVVLRSAVETALITNKRRLSLEQLSNAFDEEINRSSLNIVNPFSVPMSSVRPVPKEALVKEDDQRDAKGTNNKRGPRRKIKASMIFSKS
jgi:hypothetical protein